MYTRRMAVRRSEIVLRRALVIAAVLFCAGFSLACVTEGAVVSGQQVAKVSVTSTPAMKGLLPGDLVVCNDQIGIVCYPSEGPATFERGGKYYVYPYEGSRLMADWYDWSAIKIVGRVLPGEPAN
jgi:hypothetical protein